MLDITDEEFSLLAGYMKSNFGINLTHKRALIVGRLQNYLIQNEINSFAEYYRLLCSDISGSLPIELLNKLTTNYTFFAREVQHFDFFKNHILPELVRINCNSKDLRVWSAGCSTGEEPYTLAMIMADYFRDMEGQWDTKILATDISKKALDSANSGMYLNDQLDALPENWKRNYFHRIDNVKSIISSNIKKEVIFRTFNLMNEVFPFKKKFHVIFCRNVMIYFDNQTRTDLINRFYESTEKGGFLFIGHSESINRDHSRYKYVMPAVYRKE